MGDLKTISELKMKNLCLLLIAISLLLSASHPIYARPQKHRILYVNSYHRGYQWSDDIEKGLLKALSIRIKPDGSFNPSESNVDLRIFRMDTKINRSEAFKRKAALAAKGLIEHYRPDLIICSDDNAAKYLIVPYYINSAFPVVFCGLNWDASVYGFPARNVTGMVEVDPLSETLDLLKGSKNHGTVNYR